MAALNKICQSKPAFTVVETLRMWGLKDKGFSPLSIAYALNKSRGFRAPLIESSHITSRLAWLKQGRV